MSKNTNPVKIQNTIRDTNQSNFAGILSAKQMTEAESHAGEVGYSSIQAGGGTFFAVPVAEGRDPWDEFKMGLTPNIGSLKHLLVDLKILIKQQY